MSERAELQDVDPALDLEAAARDDREPDDFARASIRRVVPAVGAARLQSVAQLQAPVSIFNPAAVAKLRLVLQKTTTADAEQWVQRVEREHGLVRLVRVPFVETEAWRVKEEARRAKQRPPKPCAAMRRHKSRKLRQLLGIDLNFDD